jgi:hypothetical protein
MTVSAVIGAICFVIVHFTKLFVRWSEGHEWLTKLFTTLLRDRRKAAYLQLTANSFVFVSWGAAFWSTRGIIALIGTLMPVFFGSITAWKVFTKKTT